VGGVLRRLHLLLPPLVLALAFLLPATSAFAQEFPKLSGRVVDAANLLDPAQEAELDGKLAALQQASTRQLVVATIPDLQDYPIEEYGYRLGRSWGIGQSEANNGTILIVAPKEKKVRIEVGYGLEPILTDALSSLIIQNAILPRFRAGDMAGGIVAGTDAVIQQLQAPPEEAEKRAMEAAAQNKQKRSSQGKQGSFFAGIFPLFFWGVVLVFIFFSMVGRAHKRHGRYKGKRYGGSTWPIVLWTIANEIERSSRGRSSGGWSGGGNWGGGGSSWGGGGGGFGGFSGGGGSFGGGGASGSW
jgi:uncharacterized protein